MTEVYKNLLENNLEMLRALPVEIPDEGIILGFTSFSHDLNGRFHEFDNLHYPMGITYLEHGVRGVAELAAEKISPDNSEEENDFLEGIRQVYLELAAYFLRYLPPLEERIGSASDTAEVERLRIMRENIAAIAAGKPQSFAQAIQLFYLMWRIRCLESYACIGRLDVHLRPFYEADIAAGRLTEAEALGLLCQLWNRINECGSGDTLINVMVGGRREDGSDDSSNLSVLMLKASQIVRKTEPHINVRWHKGIRVDVMEEAYRVQLMGHGQASVYNDEVVIPSLIHYGVPPAYACRYANDGCTEIMIDGGSIINFNHIDIVAVFELALNNGGLTPKNPQPVRYCSKDQPQNIYHPDAFGGFETGNPDELETYEAFYELFLRQYRYQVDKKLEMMHLDHEHEKSWTGSFFLNGTYETVLETKKNIFRGGLPATCFMTFMGSIPTAADCLAALRQVVYEKKHYTLREVKAALAANFEGYETMRAELLAAPKFGNDIDEVDDIAADIAKHACDWVEEYHEKTGFYVLPALVGWRFVEEAYGVGATPDGRKYGDPIAEHYCATPGGAVKGPTALLQSVAKAPLYRAAGVATTHISLPAAISQDEETGLAVLRQLVQGAMEQGLVMLNIAIYDVEMMRKAQEYPEQYPDLIVRVWGFSARFVDLSREMQEHVIHRVLQQ